MSRSRSGGGLGGDQVEGTRAVLELLRAGRRRVRDVWLARDAGTEEIERLARDADVPLRRVDRDALARRARTESPQGVLAWAEPLPEADLDDLLADPTAFLVALDGVTDPQNLGAVMRVVDAAGATGIVIPRHRSASVTPAAAKAAAGAIESLRIAPVAGVPGTLDRAARAGVWSVGLDATGDHELFELEVADRAVLLVLGAEGSGLSRLTRERCDLLVRIPMRGAVASLNVATAAAIACYEIVRRRDTLTKRPG
ncbi:MAG: 23S rRNA (guanosine(2251)-2'-O)-methyltransferase RlmB [Acidimicrobiia bacterium]